MSTTLKETYRCKLELCDKDGVPYENQAVYVLHDIINDLRIGTNFQLFATVGRNHRLIIHSHHETDAVVESLIQIFTKDLESRIQSDMAENIVKLRYRELMSYLNHPTLGEKEPLHTYVVVKIYQNDKVIVTLDVALPTTVDNPLCRHITTMIHK